MASLTVILTRNPEYRTIFKRPQGPTLRIPQFHRHAYEGGVGVIGMVLALPRSDQSCTELRYSVNLSSVRGSPSSLRERLVLQPKEFVRTASIPVDGPNKRLWGPGPCRRFCIVKLRH